MMLAREPIIPRTDKPFKVRIIVQTFFHLQFSCLDPTRAVWQPCWSVVWSFFQTSIVFSLEEGPGQLFKALAVFALRQINLTKVCPITLSCHIYACCRNDSLYARFFNGLQIESRPHKERPLRVSDDCLLKLDAKPVAFKIIRFHFPQLYIVYEHYLWCLYLTNQFNPWLHQELRLPLLCRPWGFNGWSKNSECSRKFEGALSWLVLSGQRELCSCRFIYRSLQPF